MKINWQNVSKQEFIEKYWQKQPILLKNAIKDFDPEVDANEVAGLAMESFIDSRVITNNKDEWLVAHGPFDDFTKFGEHNWSLLVQGVDNWLPSVAALKNLVDFIPQWRTDDVMVSYSTPFGGVGAHLDQYDVFIIQGEGLRQWQVGAVDRAAKQVETATDLLQLAEFEPIIDEYVSPGDILYIPPFAPHKGVTIETSLAFSIGFRAPSSQELLSGFADFAIDNNLGHERYTDSQLTIDPKSFNLCPNQVKAMQSQVVEMLNDSELFEQFLLTRLTSATRELNVEPLEWKLSVEDGFELFSEEQVIAKVLGVKTAIFRGESSLALYCDGEKFELKPQQIEFVELLNTPSVDGQINLKKVQNCIENSQLLTTLINYGYYYIVDNDELQG